MKTLDIAFKDLIRSFRSTFALVFMFGIPLLVTGLFYFMFGNMASQGGFDLPQTKVIVANLDEGGPDLGLNHSNTPGNIRADTLGEFVVKVLQSDDLADLLVVSLASDEAAARQAVDSQQAQVAVIIPVDFSRTFAETDQQAVIEFYQDPALTVGPRVVNSILSQFMDGMAGINIAVDLAVEQAPILGEANVGRVINLFLSTYQQQDSDLTASMLDVVTPGRTSKEDENQLLKIIGPIMGGMMIFYAFYTGTSSAESILQEEEGHTLQRLFTTPTPQATILSGKLLAVFITVFVQVIVLLIAAKLIFRIEWGELPSVLVTAVGIVLCASSFGIFINSLLKDTKQGGVVFGGVMTITGMIGMLPIFTGGALTDSFTAKVSLTVPQGWAGHGLLQSMQGEPFSAVCLSALVMLAWSAVFFTVGVWRFNRRYA